MMFFHIAFAIYMVNRCDSTLIDILIKVVLMEKLHIEEERSIARLPC
jgi:hypothetical protein